MFVLTEVNTNIFHQGFPSFQETSEELNVSYSSGLYELSVIFEACKGLGKSFVFLKKED